MSPSPYPPGQQPASGSSYPGYPAGPAASYSDPYGPGPGSYPGSGAPPATGPQPAVGGRADQGTTWYSAPPAASTPPPPASPYPYQQQDPGYPPAADYGTRPGQAGYPGTPAAGSRDDMRYRNGQTEDPYGPDGYSGYHSRQG
jgi:hypothetical protein